jgi:fumarate reductase subunit D
MEQEKQSGAVTASAEEKVYSVLSYFGVLCLVSILIMRDNEYVRFHAKQGLVLFIVETLFSIVTILPVLGFVVFGIVMIICAILSIIGMIQAYMGNKWEIPVIIDWAKKIRV